MNAVLLAEDEPVSRRYLVEALHSLGHRSEAVADGEVALARAHAARFDCLLLDLRLPRLRGDEVLARLRASPQAASFATPAIVLTADPDPALHGALLAQGFAAVRSKPLTVAALAGVLAETMGAAGAPHWDDAAALPATGGDAALLARLRRLMLADLPRQRERIAAAVAHGDPAAARAELHRLQAACGFCGAAALALRSEALHAAAGAGPGRALDEFLHEIDALLA